MNTVFHEGEIAVQEQVGVRMMSERVGRSIHPYLDGYVMSALSEQDFLVASVKEQTGQIWAFPIVGEPGFAHATDPHTLRIDTKPSNVDVTWDNIQLGSAIGLLGIVFSRRIRIRINGHIDSINEDHIMIRVEQGYGNCPKYIQARELVDKRLVRTSESESIEHLPAAAKALVAEADTFFIASGHPEGGMDASHRGGKPGFVRVVDGRTLLWPDYSGNMMFNTLGNIAANPETGLLFINFEDDEVLQLTGTASILYDDPRQATFAGAERLIQFTMTKGTWFRHRLGRRWTLLHPSPYNP